MRLYYIIFYGKINILGEEDMYKSIREFIEKIKKNPNMIALISYGKIKIDKDVEENVDICIIMNNFNLNIESVHFDIKGVPVSASLRAYNDLLKDKPLSQKDLLLLEGEVLFDKSGIISRMIAKSREKWDKKEENIKIYNRNEVELKRFYHKSIIDRIRNKLHDDEVYSKFLINKNLLELITTYLELNNKSYKCDRELMDYIANASPSIYGLIEEFYATSNVDKLFNVMIKVSDIVFKESLSNYKKDDFIVIARDNDSIVGDSEREEIKDLLGVKK